MAQGVVKQKAKVVPAASKSGNNIGGRTRKGARVSKPKKASSADKMQKKLAGGLVKRTEKLLGERAGHLEMIGKGRNKDPNASKEGEKKGGSKKFG